MKGRHCNIIPECYVDTVLVQVISGLKGVNHQSTCSQVASTVEKKFKDEFALGIIDADKRQPDYALQCREIIHSEELTLVKHPDKSHYFIKINHVMEHCILNAAKEIKYDLSANGYPSTLDGMKKITKHKNSLENPNLIKLFGSLSSAPTMRILRETITYLLKHPYDADESDLRSIFMNIESEE